VSSRCAMSSSAGKKAQTPPVRLVRPCQSWPGLTRSTLLVSPRMGTITRRGCGKSFGSFGGQASWRNIRFSPKSTFPCRKPVGRSAANAPTLPGRSKRQSFRPTRAIPGQRAEAVPRHCVKYLRENVGIFLGCFD